MTEQHDVVVVGSANADLVVRVERWPAPGHTVPGSDLAVVPGGKGANQAVAAARLGGRVAFVGRVGDDPYGTLLRGSLERAGVALDGLVTTPGPSGTALITVGPQGESSIIVSPGANGRVTPDDIDRAAAPIGAARVVSLQLEIPMPAVRRAAETAAAAGARVVLNPSPAGPVPPAVLALCDPLVVNEHEAAYLLDGAVGDPAAGAAALRALGPRSAVITLGAAGAVTADATGTARIPAPRVRAVDTTGAGDAFTAALCLRLARGDDLAAAARFAVRAGAAAVRREGAQPSFPTAAELP
ncbi:ribokinase [Thermomonospora amylolytica]|uniref:ribokinase n=1 Tax=Thermomonospora amylolytica TaxID=1411117 RepID=UPI000E6BEA9A|nr:ribokinase [Thermomonospora amylolytica]